MPQLDSVDVVSIQCKYDELTHRYVIRWEDASGLRYESSSDDLQSINDAHPLDDFTQSNYVVTVPDGAVEYSVISLSAAEYNNVLSRYMTVENTGVAPLADIHIKRKQKDFDLPQRATLLYNNGTTKELGVVWSEEDVNKVNTKLRGTYYVNGQIQQPIYRNPFIEGRADPWIIKGDDGYYYFTATYPMKIGRAHV